MTERRTAHGWLVEAGNTIRQRGKDRDQSDGERSMAKTVAIFEAITGQPMSEADGWLFMVALKLARGDDDDSLIDGIAYLALRAEALSRNWVGDE